MQPGASRKLWPLPLGFNVSRAHRAEMLQEGPGRSRSFRGSGLTAREPHQQGLLASDLWLVFQGVAVPPPTHRPKEGV